MEWNKIHPIDTDILIAGLVDVHCNRDYHPVFMIAQYHQEQGWRYYNETTLKWESPPFTVRYWCEIPDYPK